MKCKENTPKTKASVALMENTLAKADYLEHGFVYGMAKIFGEISQQITEEAVRNVFKNGLKDGLITIGTQAMKEMLAEANAMGNVPVNDSLTYGGDSVTFLKEAPKAIVAEESAKATEAEDVWITVNEAAKHLKVGMNKMYALTKLPDFPCEKQGRKIMISQVNLDSWKESHPNFAELARQLRHTHQQVETEE